MTLVNRETELRELRALSSTQPAIALLYGRRRVGKTFLLDHVWPGGEVFYFLAADSTAALNRAELVRELGSFLERELSLDDFPTWRSVFRFLVSLSDEKPLLVVLDELQYLMGAEDDIVSQLIAVWDREARGKAITLVLCGSEVGTMERLRQGDSPLFGRLAWAGRLRPFDYFDAAKMLPGYEHRDATMIYGLLGGMPHYLSFVPSSASLQEIAARLVLSPRGPVRLQLETLIEQEKGIRQPAEYRAVLAAIAAGRTTKNEIAQAAGLQERPHVVRHALETLESLELVWRETIFDAKRNAPVRYRIADNAVRFWHRFVHPNRSGLETGDAHAVWQSRVVPGWNPYMGKVFEGICAQGFSRLCERWGLAAPSRWQRWEGKDRSRTQIEIDVVAMLEDQRILTGEIKWSSQPVDYDLHLKLMHNLEALVASGHAWARAALSDEGSAGHIYFSAAGFTDFFRNKAATAGNIHLVTIEDLFAD